MHRTDHLSDAYAPVTILRLLQLMSRAEDGWRRTDQLMDHLEETGTAEEEVSSLTVHCLTSCPQWDWYNRKIISFIRRDLGLASVYSEADIRHVIGLINVNAVCLQFPKMIGAPSTEVGKGCCLTDIRTTAIIFVSILDI